MPLENRVLLVAAHGAVSRGGEPALVRAALEGPEVLRGDLRRILLDSLPDLRALPATTRGRWLISGPGEHASPVQSVFGGTAESAVVRWLG